MLEVPRTFHRPSSLRYSARVTVRTSWMGTSAEIATVSEWVVPSAPVAVSRKTRVDAPAGKVKVGLGVLAPASTTDGVPEICSQRSDTAFVVALPSRTTRAPTATVWSGPAFATGAGGGATSAKMTTESE